MPDRQAGIFERGDTNADGVLDGLDLSAVLIMLVSVTGLTLSFFRHKRIALGLWLLAIGTAIGVAVYAWFVW